MSETSTTEPKTMQKPRRYRTGRKRTRFQVPARQPASVRALWQSASAEEQKAAHTLCMAILEYWLGKASKAEIAARLEVPPLRVWQLSQMALSGMLAGLLRQPKTRRRGRPVEPPTSPGEDPRPLRARIRELERKLSHTEDLVRVLRDLPWAPSAGKAKESRRASGKAAGRGTRTRRATVSPGDATRSGHATEARDAARHEGRGGQGDGRDASSDA